ncbi:MAG: hypothetical protein ACSHXF_08350 [Aquaticitalea sp.]
MKSIIKLILTITIISSSLQGMSQETNVKPIRIGAKLGLPNLISLNLEYVVPVLDHRLAVTGDFSKIKSSSILKIVGSDDDEDLDMSFTYYEGGLNYYIFKPGKGLYAGMSISNFKFNGVLFDHFDATTENEEVYADGHIDYKQTSFNIKFGAKLGGLFYFRPEVGYAFNAFPSTIPIRGTYDDGTTVTEDYETYVNDAIPKGLIFNIGFGFSF